MPYLNKLGIRQIDHLWISHPHTDHYGGIDILLSEKIEIHNIYYSKAPDGHSDFDYKPEEFFASLTRAQKTGTKLVDVFAGFKLQMPSTSMRVLFCS